MAEIDTTTLENAGITLSARAAKQIGQILAGEPTGSMLRVAVNGGGCSGFQYDFEIVQAQGEDDYLIERDGVTVLVDQISAEYMPGAEIDYADELIGAAFKINNPVATASCGCGTSFSV
ncbi:MAG: iron-sulfur cluster insertion protein ErpA [Pseudomonadota bacterium]